MYKKSIQHQKANSSCPYCSGKKVLKGFNDVNTTHPEIAMKITNDIDKYIHTAYSSKIIEFNCENGHTYMAPIARVTKGSGCTYCTGKGTLRGFNDMFTTNPELAHQLNDINDSYKYRVSSNKKLKWMCSFGHTWYASPNAMCRNNKCPTCSKLKNNIYVTKINTDINKRELIKVLLLLTNRDMKIDNEYILITTPTCDIDIAIKFNSIVHKTPYILSRKYHAEKSNKCSEIGYQLIHVWEDDWMYRKKCSYKNSRS